MPRTEQFSLDETTHAGGAQEQEHGTRGSSRQTTSQRKRTLVLVGASLSQLPIWGFAMSYGVFQEYYTNPDTTNWTVAGNKNTTGVIGTTSNGVMYLSMPFLFALFTRRRWARRRQAAALCGTLLACMSFLASSFSTHVGHIVATQGVLSALGCALVFSPTTLSLGEWFNADTGSNRALAYGVTLSCKNVVGSTCPFLMRVLLDRYGFRGALRIWAAAVAATSIPAVLMVPGHPSAIGDEQPRHESRVVPWAFLKHRTFWVYSVAIILQSSGYGIPQTYLNTYAHDVAELSQTSATLLLTLFNVPGIASSSFFGYLSDNRYIRLSAATVTFVSAAGSALAAFLFWGLTSEEQRGGGMALLVLFSVTFGFFAGGYSGTWGGVINELEREAAGRNEAIDSGFVYGMMNGARGIGYVAGGLAGVKLLQAGGLTMQQQQQKNKGFAYGTSYGPLIVFTGLSSVIGGWAVLWRWRWRRLLTRVHE